MRRRGIELPAESLVPTPTAWPAPAAAPVLLYGGTFDPPHRAHVELAVAARDTLFGPDGWLVYVPAARSPHKPDGPVASDAHRLAMLGLATKARERTAIWTDEIDRAAHGRGGPSYWIDTLRRAVSVADEAVPLRFLIGADQAVAFHRWRDAYEIHPIAEPAVMLREPHSTAETLGLALRNAGIDPDPWLGRVVDVPVRPESSTEVRTGTAGLVSEPVARYIDEHDLYR